jgi:ParB-like chromosome segregation protein Spo0J
MTNRFEYKSLKSSIASKGVQTPVVINQNNVILDGHHRVKACRELSIENIPVLVKSFDNKFDEQDFVIFTN